MIKYLYTYQPTNIKTISKLISHFVIIPAGVNILRPDPTIHIIGLYVKVYVIIICTRLHDTISALQLIVVVYDLAHSPWTKSTVAWWTARVLVGPRQSETAAVRLSGRFAVRPSSEPAPPSRCQSD